MKVRKGQIDPFYQINDILTRITPAFPQFQIDAM